MKWTILIILSLLSMCVIVVGQTMSGGTITGVKFGNDPRAISGLTAWYAPEGPFIFDNTAGTTTVSSWSDLSGNGNTVTQSTKANQPVYQTTNTVNGYSTLRFNGTQRLPAGSVAITNLTNGNDIPYSCFCVVFMEASANEVSFGWGNSTNATPAVLNRPIITSTYRNSRVDNTSTVVNASSGANTSTNTIWQIEGYSFAGTTALMQCNQFRATPTHNVGPIDLNTFCIGAYQRNATFANQLNGNIAEIVIYNRQLSLDEFATVINYLNRKYIVF